MSDDRFIMKTSRTPALAPLPHSLMKKTLFCFAVAMSVALSSEAQVTPIPVDNTGYATNTFDTLPGLANGFSHLNMAGAAADVTNSVTLDADVNANVTAA